MRPICGTTKAALCGFPTHQTRIPYSPDKDKSDVELTVEYALEQGCQEIILVAAVGGRLDDTLGNVALVASYPGRIAILDGVSILVAVNKSEKCILHGQVGTPVSLIKTEWATLPRRSNLL